MPRVKKDILYPGTYHLPDGRTVSYSRADVKHLKRRLKDMLAAGLHVPMAWGHQDEARPRTVDEILANRARFCLGHAADASETPEGILEVDLDVPDPADAKRLPSVRFVSPEISEDFVDSTGRLWPGPSITHIAATGRPVQHKQKPFSVQMGADRVWLDLGDLVVEESEGEEMAGSKLERLKKCLESSGVENVDRMPDPAKSLDKFLDWLTDTLAAKCGGDRMNDDEEDMDIERTDAARLGEMTGSQLQHATTRGSRARQGREGAAAFEQTLKSGRARY